MFSVLEIITSAVAKTSSLITFDPVMCKQTCIVTQTSAPKCSDLFFFQFPSPRQNVGDTDVDLHRCGVVSGITCRQCDSCVLQQERNWVWPMTLFKTFWFIQEQYYGFNMLPMTMHRDTAFYISSVKPNQLITVHYFNLTLILKFNAHLLVFFPKRRRLIPLSCLRIKHGPEPGGD